MKVSVIIPTYNRAHTLGKAIRSALNQTTPPLEVLVCDDGSTDDSRSLVRKMTEKDRRVKWIQGKRSGQPAITRNRGIQEAKGEWLAFLDSDDQWTSRKLEKQLKAIKQNNCLAACTNAKILKVNDQGKQRLSLYPFLEYNRLTISFKNLIKDNKIICSSALIHKSIFELVKGFPEDSELVSVEDYALWLRVASFTNFVFINKPLVFYRDDPKNSIRYQEIKNFHLRKRKIIQNFIDWARANGSLVKEVAIARKEMEKTKPRVTVLMPVYNSENTIKQAIRSILNQTFIDFEFLIINDGSTDRSLKMISSFKDSRIRIINRKQNLGIVSSVNQGMELAQGDFIARMDADDISAPNRLKNQLRYLLKNPEIGVCGANMKAFGDVAKEYIINYPKTHEEITCSFLFENAIAHPTVMFRKKVFSSNKLVYNPAMTCAEDFDLWIRAAKYTRLANLDQTLLKYRSHGGQKSRKDNELRKDREIMRILLGQLEEIGLNPSQEEKVIHDRIRHYRIPETYQELQDVKHWFEKIIRYNQKSKVHSDKILKRIIAPKWNKICKNFTNQLRGSTWKIYWDFEVSRYYDMTLKMKYVFLKACLKNHLIFFVRKMREKSKITRGALAGDFAQKRKSGQIPKVKKKVKIYTYADKTPHFIFWQLKSFQHFLKDDFEFIIFDNSSSRYLSLKNRLICFLLGIKCVPIKKKNHSTPNYATAQAIQWSFENHIIHDKNCISCIFDSDIFLVNNFSVNNFLKGHDVAGAWQVREHVKYLWPGIMFFNMDSLPNKEKMNFMCGKVEGQRVDVAGLLYHWIKANPQVKIKEISNTSHINSQSNNLNVLPKIILKRYDEDFKFEIYAGKFLHYGRGSNWDHMTKDYHRRKIRLLHFYIEKAIQRMTSRK